MQTSTISNNNPPIHPITTTYTQHLAQFYCHAWNFLSSTSKYFFINIFSQQSQISPTNQPLISTEKKKQKKETKRRRKDNMTKKHTHLLSTKDNFLQTILEVETKTKELPSVDKGIGVEQRLWVFLPSHSDCRVFLRFCELPLHCSTFASGSLWKGLVGCAATPFEVSKSIHFEG